MVGLGVVVVVVVGGEVIMVEVVNEGYLMEADGGKLIDKCPCPFIYVPSARL